MLSKRVHDNIRGYHNIKVTYTYYIVYIYICMMLIKYNFYFKIYKRGYNMHHYCKYFILKLFINVPIFNILQ